VERQALKVWGPILVLGVLLLSGCNDSPSGLSKDEERNFKEGMSAQKVKEVGPPPTPPAGPLEGYKDGSANDKAEGR
jgi:hypothetical protein